MFTSSATSTLFPPLIGNVYHIRERSWRGSSQKGSGALPPSSLPHDTAQSLTKVTKSYWEDLVDFSDIRVGRVFV